MMTQSNLNDDDRMNLNKDIDQYTAFYFKQTVLVDKGIIFISAWMPLILLVFVETITTPPRPIHARLLLSSSLCFFTCTVVTIFSCFVSARAQLHARNRAVQTLMDGQKERLSERDMWNRCVEPLNWLRDLLFIVGFITAILFVWTSVFIV